MKVSYRGNAYMVKRKIGYSAVLLFKLEQEFSNDELSCSLIRDSESFYLWAWSKNKLIKKLEKKSYTFIRELEEKYGVGNVVPYGAGGCRRYKI